MCYGASSLEVFMRYKTERDHQELQQLVNDYLSHGGSITRTRDSRTAVICRACGLRKRVAGVISYWGVRCPQCGSRMRT
jgi:hypothetical protein